MQTPSRERARREDYEKRTGDWTQDYVNLQEEAGNGRKTTKSHAQTPSARADRARERARTRESKEDYEKMREEHGRLDYV